MTETNFSKFKLTQFQLIYVIILFLLISPHLVFSQNEIPREYTPEEFISLSKDVRMNTALQIINQLSLKYENKLILDKVEHKKKIGVVVDNMHWKRALEYILRSNMLKYIIHPRHYEITEMVTQKNAAILEEQININSREIEIKAIFFEADQQAMSEIGVDWSTIIDGKVKLNMDLFGSSSMSENLFSTRAYYGNDMLDIFALINTFENRSEGRVIATPQVRILEGEEGKIKVGKNFFLTTKDFAGNTRFTEYESGVILNVIPKIIKHGKISLIHLEIKAEKSDVIPSSINAIKKITEGRTQVLLLNGEETAIAGLISEERTSLRKGVPILKDLPWWFFGIRYLTGYSSQQLTKKELVIIIKAEIVPNIVSRVKSKISMKNYLKKQRDSFNKRLKEYQKK